MNTALRFVHSLLVGWVRLILNVVVTRKIFLVEMAVYFLGTKNSHLKYVVDVTHVQGLILCILAYIRQWNETVFVSMWVVRT
jgi:hypothetical protein